MFTWNLVFIREFILQKLFFVLVWGAFIPEEAFVREGRLLKIHKFREASI